MKLFEEKYFQIYATDIKTDPSKQYELIEYNPQANQILHAYSQSFFMNTGFGFMFIHNGINKLPKDFKFKSTPINTNKTEFGYVPSNNFYELSMLVSGSVHCNPKITNGIYLHFKKFAKFNKSALLNDFIKHQKLIKTFDDWYHFIQNQCPFYINYAEDINKSLTKPITYDDIFIRYNIKSKNEIEIIKWIESTFEDLNQEVKIYDSYSGLMNKVKDACDKKHIKYTIHGSNLKYKSKKNVTYLTIKFSDLNKLGLTYELLDFVS